MKEKDYKQELFNYISDKHDVYLLEDEMDEVINICRPIIKPLNQDVPDKVSLRYAYREIGELKSALLEAKRYFVLMVIVILKFK